MVEVNRDSSIGGTGPRRSQAANAIAAVIPTLSNAKRRDLGDGRCHDRAFCATHTHRSLPDGRDDILGIYFTSTTALAVRPNTSGSYISSACIGAVTNVPAVVARSM